MKKTVGIATFTGQWPLNYGSALQTTALQWLIRDNGYNVASATICLGKTFDRFYSAKRFYYRYDSLGIEWIKTFFKFRSFFRKNKIKLGGHFGEFSNDQSAEKEAEKYDLLCCGSDAIWKKMFIRPFFFWGYPKLKEKPRFSYAASMQAGEFDKDYIGKLDQFSAVSVREKTTKEIIQENIKKEITVVLDPTLTVDEIRWHEVASKRLIDEPYLLCYFLTQSERHFINVLDLARKHGMSRVVFINTDYIDKGVRVFTYYHGMEYKKTVGPAQFLSLFKYSDLICTDSYHGVCFSVVFRKQFYVMERDAKNFTRTSDYRMRDLFERLSLGERVIKYNSDVDSVKDIIWEDVEKSLRTERERSKDYLKKALNRCENGTDHK